MFTALLDTCVLWPSLQRDFLLSLAAEGMYRPVWSTEILAELQYEETDKLVRKGEDEDKAAVRASLLIEQMRSAFHDAEVHGWEGLEGTYGLPDPADEHVLAAAVVAGAGAIVTHNTKDFPRSRLPKGIDVAPPAEFAAHAVELEPLRAFDAVVAIAERSGRRGPAMTADDILDKLVERYSMIQAVRLIRLAR